MPEPMRVSAHETVLSQLTITALTDDPKFLIVKEITTSAYRRIYDGVLVFDGSSSLAILKDRLLHTARVHALDSSLKRSLQRNCLR